MNEGTSFMELVGVSEGEGPVEGIPTDTLHPMRFKSDATQDQWEYFSGWEVVAADILYSSVACDWDHDNDGIGGVLYECGDLIENGVNDCWTNPSLWRRGPDYSVDFFPEVFVGRAHLIDCAESEGIGYCVEKVMVYEQNPRNADRLTWLMATKQNRTDNLPWYYDQYTKPYLPPHINLMQNVNQWAWDVVNEMNGSIWGWCDIIAHGAPSAFGTCNEDYESGNRVILTYPAVHQEDLPNAPDLGNLTNTGKYFIAYSVRCYLAYFFMGHDNPEWASGIEGFTTFPQRGVVALLGNTSGGEANEHYKQHGRFYQWLYGPLRKANPFLGPAEVFSKQKGLNPHSEFDRIRSWASYTHNLYGSPQTPVWTRDNPSSLIAGHPISWTDGIGAPLRVKVTDGNQPVKNAMITLLLYDNSTVGYPTEDNVDVYTRALTGPDGVATFRIAPTMTGQMKVAATKQDYLPYLGICQISTKTARTKPGKDLPRSSE